MSRQYISEKAQERIFNIILKRPENLACADCTSKGPRWVSLDFGIFICMDCAGAHRTLGPSVTRVRSTNIDGWFQENVEVMDSIGNSVANSYWEYSLPKSFIKPTINAGLDALIRFVQEKYVKKKYIPQGNVIEPKQEYLNTMKTVKPFYFQQVQPPVQVQTNKVILGDLIDLDADDQFQEAYTDHPSNKSLQGTLHSASLSPPKYAESQHQPSQSLPSLDILNLYRAQSQQPSVQLQNQQQQYHHHQQQSVKTLNNNYAYLQSYNPSQQQQQQIHLQQQQQQQQTQMNMFTQFQSAPQQQQHNGQIDIMQLYAQKQ